MIDAHHYFWEKRSADPTCSLSNLICGVDDLLKSNHSLDELDYDLEYSGVEKVVSVQSRCSEAENNYLLHQAKHSEGLVAGIVGWAPLDSPRVRPFLEQYIGESYMKGYRVSIVGRDARAYFCNPDLDEGVRRLTSLGLGLDIAVSSSQLAEVISFVDKHPNQRIVLNDSGLPVVDLKKFPADWARDMRELGKRPHVYCKTSGLISDDKHRSYHLQPYFDNLMEGFSSERLMFASSWPLCNIYSSYPAKLNCVDDFIFQLSESEQANIQKITAQQFYKI